jgi:hypothetical protein
MYTHIAIAVADVQQAKALRHLTEPQAVKLAA